MRRMKRQVIVKIHGDLGLLEELLELLEQRTQGIVSKIMDSDQGDYHAFATIFEVTVE